jgi:hypothetical protein
LAFPSFIHFDLLEGTGGRVTKFLPFSACGSRPAAIKKPVELGFREQKMPDRWNSLYQAARD